MRADLTLRNELKVDSADLDRIRQLPPGAGVILTPNHADETDPRVCLEISRLVGRRFILMCNREAFDEFSGAAGWALQRLGYFSVERGAHDLPAKQYSVDVLKGGKDVLVVFPEGEIFYLNETIQPFHSGAVDICMQALSERRKDDPNWTAYAVPTWPIKYTYPGHIEGILHRRVHKMEKDLSLTADGETLRQRLHVILKELLRREEEKHQLTNLVHDDEKLSEQVTDVRHAILEQLEEKYNESSARQRRTIDASWQLGAKLRDMIADGAEHPTEIRKDLSACNEVAHLASWQPKYIVANPSSDRLAEVLLKLERELYHVKRPRQLAKRDVHVRIGDPVELGQFLDDYSSDPHGLRNKLTEQLHSTIQALIDTMVAITA